MSEQEQGNASSDNHGVDVVRRVFSAIGWEFNESMGDDEEETVFLIDTSEDDLLASAKAVHYPGRVVLQGHAHLTIDAAHLPAARAYISLFNNALQSGCLCVRDPAPAEVFIRTSVNYEKVETLEEGLVAGVISDMIDIAEISLGGLEAVAKGMDPDKAFDTYVAGM